ncbi:hypothetical protein D3C71_1551940 [compost metagenome]
MGNIIGSEQIDIDMPFPYLGVHLCNGAEGRHAGIVDQHVERTQLALKRGYCLLGCFPDRNVCHRYADLHIIFLGNGGFQRPQISSRPRDQSQISALLG